MLTAPFGHHDTDPQYKQRYDFNDDNVITIVDVSRLSPFFGKRCD
jgi:hypothetical protein